jgi:hypothetical protein
MRMAITYEFLTKADVARLYELTKNYNRTITKWHNDTTLIAYGSFSELLGLVAISSNFSNYHARFI